MDKQTPPYPLRLPSDLRNWVERKAKENDRSLNSELIHRIKESKRQEEAKTTN